MKKEEKCYGIYFNDKIPKMDKKNQFDKEVTIKFEGKAYLIVPKEKNEFEKIEIENEHQLKKEGNYEIEFINLENEMYHLQIKIKSSFLLLLFFLFLFGAIIAFFLCNPAFQGKSPFAQVFDSINLSVLPLNIGKKGESKNFFDNMEKEKSIEIDKKQNKKTNLENEYDFDVSLKKENSQDIYLFKTISSEGLRKISPGNSGSFAIMMSAEKSKVDMEYQIKFEDLTEEKPTNLLFRIRGENENYATLQELATNLKGKIRKQMKKKIVIDWQWPYETGQNEKSIMENDQIDTTEGEKLNCYQFKIMVIGKESV